MGEPDYGMCPMSDMGHGPFGARPKPRKDATLASMDGDEATVPGGSGLTYSGPRGHDEQAPYGSTLLGYHGTGQRPVQPAKED